MEKRHQIRVGGHKIDFDYDTDTQTWRTRRPGSQDHATGQADTLEAARDAVRRYIQGEESAAESLSGTRQRSEYRAGPSGPARYRLKKLAPDSAPAAHGDGWPSLAR